MAQILNKYKAVAIVFVIGIILCCHHCWIVKTLYAAIDASRSPWQRTIELRANTDNTYQLRIKGLDSESSFAQGALNMTEPTYFENVCIQPNDVMHPYRRPFIARVNAYAGGRPTEYGGKSLVYELDWRRHANKSYWLIHAHNEDVPPAWPVVPAVAYFPRRWRCSDNIYLLWGHSATGVYKQMKWSQTIPEIRDASLPQHLIAPIYGSYFQSHYAHVLYDMGISEIHAFDAVWRKSPVCFKYGIFGLQNYNRDLVIGADDMGAKLQTKWGLTSPCKVNYVLLLDRIKSRHILNAGEIMNHLKKMGYNVKLDYFDNKSLTEQMDSVRCASAFIGVQGAGLSWFQFLQPNVTFVEFYWRGWKSKYEVRVNITRPDVSAHAVECHPMPSQSTMMKYARLWFKHYGPIDDAMTTRLIEKSDKVKPISGTIWKDSNIVCDIDKLSRIFNKTHQSWP